MHSFKQYLKESANDFAPWHITDPIEVEKYVNTHPDMFRNGDWKVLKNGKLSAKRLITTINGDGIDIGNGEYGLPVCIASAKILHIESKKINNLIGIPKKGDGLHLECDNLTSLDTVSGEFLSISIECPKLTTFGKAKIKTNRLAFYKLGSYIPLKEIYTCVEDYNSSHFSLIFSTLVAELYYRKPLLSFLLIKSSGQKEFTFSGMSFDQNSAKLKELKNVLNIINKYTDVWKCQDVLQDADLDDYADL